MYWTTLKRAVNGLNGLSCQENSITEANKHSPENSCTESHCTKRCFAGGHFDWCIEHSAPSSEDVHGTYHVMEVTISRINGHTSERRDVVEKRKCSVGKEQKSDDPGCDIVQSGQYPVYLVSQSFKLIVLEFMGDNGLREFEMDRWFADQMGKDSP